MPLTRPSKNEPSDKEMDKFLDNINRVEVDKFLNLGKYGKSLKGDDVTISPTGARGPYQILKSTAKNPGYGVPSISWEDDVDDYDKSRAWAKKYITELYKRLDGNWEDVAMAYNQGIGRVQRMRRGANTASKEKQRQYMKEGLPYSASVISGMGRVPSSVPTRRPSR
jgi:hypothetical protein